MSGLALPRLPPTALRWPPRPLAPEVVRRVVIAAARPEQTPRIPVTRTRRAGPLAMSLLGHGGIAAVGLLATLLLPASPPAPAPSPPAFSVELAFAPMPTAPAPGPLPDMVPMPQPPPDALVVPRAADLAAALPAPETPPSPVAVPHAVDMAAALPTPRAPPAPLLVPQPADLAAAIADPATPPAPVIAPPALPMPPPAPPQRPARPARHAAKPAPARPAPVTPTSAGAVAGPIAAPPPQAAVDTAPMLIASPRFRVPPRPPVYPRRAVELRAQGEALIGALLDPSGTPHDVRVLRSSGHPMLDRAALDAVGGWAFEPGRRAGRPVAARVEIPVRFTLR